jgi:hypothetical protein
MVQLTPHRMKETDHDAVKVQRRADCLAFANFVSPSSAVWLILCVALCQYRVFVLPLETPRLPQPVERIFALARQLASRVVA